MTLSAAAKLDRVMRTGDWPTEVLHLFPPPPARRPGRIGPRHRAYPTPWDRARIRRDAFLVLWVAAGSIVLGQLVGVLTAR